MKEDYLEVVAIYMVVMIVGCVVLALPGVTFAIIAGTLFGPWMGTFLCCNPGIPRGTIFSEGQPQR